MKISIVLSLFTIAVSLLTLIAQPLGINMIFLFMFLTLAVIMFTLKDPKQDTSIAGYKGVIAELKLSTSSKVVTSEGEIVELKSNF